MSLGQIKEIPCGYSRGHISCSINLIKSKIKVKKYLAGILEATFFSQVTLKLVRMFVLMTPWMSSNLGHLGHKVGN